MLEGRSTYWNKDGVKLADEDYVQGQLEKRVDWYATGEKCLSKLYTGRLDGESSFWYEKFQEKEKKELKTIRKAF